MLKTNTISIATDYDNTSKQHQHKVFLGLISPIEIQPGLNCLDIGCGSGNNTALLAQWVGKEGSVVGIDPDMKRIELAIENNKTFLNSRFMVGKSIDFPLLNSGYDLIVANLVMHWIAPHEKLETYQKIFHALKPGGYFAFTELTNCIGDSFRFLAFAQKDGDGLKEHVFLPATLEENQKIFSSLDFEIVRLDESLCQNNIESLDAYFTWLDSTFYGKMDGRKIYAEHKDELGLKINADGSVLHEINHSNIIVRKPID